MYRVIFLAYILQHCALKIFASSAEYDRELSVYRRIARELSSYQDLPLSRLVCPLELTKSNKRGSLKVPPHAGALVVCPLADGTLSELTYNCCDAFRVAHSVLRALTALHELDICHADMSNSNVLIMFAQPIQVSCYSVLLPITHTF